MTNFDWIKDYVSKMTIEDILDEIAICRYIDEATKEKYCRNTDYDCESCMRAWLEKEAEV